MNNPNAANPTTTVNTTTNYTLEITDDNGCVDTDQVQVTVQGAPTIDLTVDAPVLVTTFNGLTTYFICGIGSFDFAFSDQSTGANGATFSVDYGNALNLAPGNTGWADTITYNTGFYNGSYTINNANGCSSSLDFNVFVGDVPDGGAVANGVTTVCVGDPISLSWTNIGNNPIGTNYIVDWGDGNIDTFTHPPPAVVPHTYALSSCSQPNGEYSVNYEIVNPCDSRTGGFNQVRVSETPVADFTLSADTLCVNSTLTINDASVGAQAPACGTPNHVWSVVPGTYTLVSGALGNINGQPASPSLWTPGSASLQVSFTAPGTYTITDVVGNNICGTDTLVRTVCVEEPPVPDFEIQPDNGCAPHSVSTTNNTVVLNACLVEYEWVVSYLGGNCSAGGAFSFTNGTNATSFEPEFLFTDGGQYEILLEATNTCGTFDHRDTVNVLSPPQVDLDVISGICAGDCISPTAVFEDCGNPPLTYGWTFPGGTPAVSALQNPGAICYPMAGTFTITVSDTNSCGFATDDTTIVVVPPPNQPTISGDLTICEGDSINLTTVASGPWQWLTPSGAYNSQSITIEPAASSDSGQYNLTVGSGACSAFNTVTVTVIPLPAVDAGPDTSVCLNGASIVLNNGSPVGGVWSGGGVSQVGSNYQFTPTQPLLGINTIYYEWTDGNGCTNLDSIEVVVDPLPTAFAGNDTTLCDEALPFVLSGSPAGGNWLFSSQVTAATLVGNVYTPNGTGTDVLTYDYVDAAGCSASDIIEITVVPPPVVNAGVDDSLCVDAPSLQLTSTPQGVWSVSPGSSGSVTAGGLYMPATIGVDTLISIVSLANCDDRDTMLLTVLPLPAVDAGPDTSVCLNGASIVLNNGSPVGGVWSGGGVSQVGSNYQFTPTQPLLGINTIYYEWTDGNGCTNLDSIEVVVDPLPTAFAGNDTTLCDEALPFVLSGSPAGGNWLFSSQVTAATLVGNVYTPNGTGTDVLTYDYVDAAGCSASDIIEITVVPPPVVNAGVDDSLCVDAPSLQLTSTPQGVWSVSPGSSGSVTAGGLYMPATIGVDTLISIVSLANCDDRDTMLLTVIPLPAVDAGPDTSVCLNGASIVLNNGSPVGGVWSGGGVSQVGSNYQFTPTQPLLGINTIYYEWTDGNGCTNLDSIEVVVDPLPTAFAGNDTTLCDEALPFVLSGSPAGGNWLFSSQVTAATLVGNVYTPNGTGTDVLTYDYVDAAGCSASDIIEITVVPPPVVNAGVDDSLCVDAPSLQLTSTPQGVWSVSPGSSGSVTAGGLYMPATIGVDTLISIVSLANCDDRDTMLLTVLPLPAVDAGPDYSICQYVGPQTLMGSPTGGSWSMPNVFDPDTMLTGTHTWCYTYMDPSTNCDSTDCVTVNIEPVPVTNFIYPDTVCVNTTVNFTNTTGCPTCSWEWDFGDSSPLSAAMSPSHSYQDTGVYQVSLLAGSGFGCLDSIEYPIVVIETPTADFTTTTTSGCGPLATSFLNQSLGLPADYVWDIDSVGQFTSSNPGPVLFPVAPCDSAFYGIQLTASNICGVHRGNGFGTGLRPATGSIAAKCQHNLLPRYRTRGLHNQLRLEHHLHRAIR